jgi:hypothetical protein
MVEVAFYLWATEILALVYNINCFPIKIIRVIKSLKKRLILKFSDPVEIFQDYTWKDIVNELK